MANKSNTADAVEILRRRYIGEDIARKASVEQERLNVDIAQMIYDYRNWAGLSQKELAELVGTTQSAISRLESAEYEGHSLTMLDRIAKAINRKVSVDMPSRDPEVETMRFAFKELVRGLRREKGLTVKQLAGKLKLPEHELAALERSATYRIKPLMLHRLSEFFGIPQRTMAVLAGAVKDVPAEVREQASKFAAKSDSFAKLTAEEKRVLDEFVKALKSET